MPLTPPLYVFEDSQVDRLYPLTLCRAACELRVGMLTLLQRLQKHLGEPLAGLFVREALAESVRPRVHVPVNPGISTKEGVLLLNARLLGSPAAAVLKDSAPDSAGIAHASIAWMHLGAQNAGSLDFSRLADPRTLEALLPKVQRVPLSGHGSGGVGSTLSLIERPWDLLDHQRAGIVEDFADAGPANHAEVLPGAHLLETRHIHLAAGVRVWPGAVLDAQKGPILVGAGTEIRANAVITGPVAIGPNCIIRTGADIREETVLGPGCRVGGEVAHSLFLGNASKQHLGFLGQSIVGEWANLGAGTTTSNLKNTYGTVKLPISGTDESTGKQFMGSLIADHAKLGIGTYLSTGSVVGFASHVVVDRPPRFVPSFAWVTDKGVRRADFEKIEAIATIAMGRRGVEFCSVDHELFVRIANETATAEKFEWKEGA